MDVPLLLRTARARAGLSQRRLAEALCLSRTVITDYESGRASPTTRTLDRLLAGCGLQARVTLEPLRAELEAQVDALIKAPPPRADLDLLTRFADSLDDAPGHEPIGIASMASSRPGPVTWAFDGATALVLHGIAVQEHGTGLVAADDEALRHWLRLAMAVGTWPNGLPYRRWLDGDLAETAAALQGSCFSLLGLVSVRVVDQLPATVTLLPEGGSRPLPVVPVDEVERSHPAHAEVLARWRQKRAADVA